MSQNLTQQNTGTQLQEHERAVITLMRVMMADYGSRYKVVCKDKQSATAYKNRLMKKFSEFNPQDIYDGYENCTEEEPKFMPSIPDLYAHIKILHDKRKNNKAQQEEAGRIAQKPTTTHTVDAVKLLRDTMQASKPKSEEDRLKRLAAARQNHAAVLQLHGKNITKRYVDESHQCAMGGCFKAGSTSSGAGYVCREHYRMR